MIEQLSGNVAVVTGGASGIGQALSEELARRGCEVVLADRQAKLAEESARRINERGAHARATAVELDVRDAAAFKQVVKETVARSGRIDFLFNNAGIAIGAEMSECTPADFDDVFDVNLRGVAYGILAAYPAMIAQGNGHIVNTASVAGLVATPGAGSYTAAKHAVVALSKSLRVEARLHGVKVSVLCPGAIRTPILSGGQFGRINIEGATPAAVLRQWEKVRPMDPAKLATRAIDGVLANDPIIVVPRWWKALWYVDRLSPSLAIALGSAIHTYLRNELRADANRDATRTGGADEGAKTNGYHSARA